MSATTPRDRAIPLFLALAFGLSVPLYVLIARGGGLSHQGTFVLALMWCPAAAAVATQLLTHRSLRALGWHWPAIRWLALGYFLPLAYSIVAYGGVWLTGFGRVDLSGRPQGTVAFVVLGSLISLVSATGEEIGWRGFLVPALSRRWSFGTTALVSGLIWGVWHVPLILFAGYNAGTPAWFAIPCFLVGVLALATMLAWLRIRSSSFWPGALLHASHNLYVQGFFDRITIDTGVTRWLTGEFGAVFVAVLLVTGTLFHRARHQLPSSDAMP